MKESVCIGNKLNKPSVIFTSREEGRRGSNLISIGD